MAFPRPSPLVGQVIEHRDSLIHPIKHMSVLGYRIVKFEPSGLSGSPYTDRLVRLLRECPEADVVEFDALGAPSSVVDFTLIIRNPSKPQNGAIADLAELVKSQWMRAPR